MATPIENRNFAQQISLDDYNKQKKKYTERALLELKSQMATFTPIHDTVRSDSDEYDSDDSRDTAGVNVIIKTYNDSAKSVEKDTNTGLRRRRKPATSNDEGANGLSNSIYVQRELDIQELQNLKNQVKRLKSTLEEEERKNHFLKLELCNAQVDATDLKQVLSMRDNKIKNLENAQNADWWKIITLKMFIGLLVLLYIYIVLF
jgi:hypothetical protein